MEVISRKTMCCEMVSSGNTVAKDYWLVQNSWGTSWGESGLIKMSIIGGRGECGVN